MRKGTVEAIIQHNTEKATHQELTEKLLRGALTDAVPEVATLKREESANPQEELLYSLKHAISDDIPTREFPDYLDTTSKMAILRRADAVARKAVDSSVKGTIDPETRQKENEGFYF